MGAAIAGTIFCIAICQCSVLAELYGIIWIYKEDEIKKRSKVIASTICAITAVYLYIEMLLLSAKILQIIILLLAIPAWIL